MEFEDTNSKILLHMMFVESFILGGLGWGGRGILFEILPVVGGPGPRASVCVCACVREE